MYVLTTKNVARHSTSLKKCSSLLPFSQKNVTFLPIHSKSNSLFQFSRKNITLYSYFLKKCSYSPALKILYFHTNFLKNVCFNSKFSQKCQFLPTCTQNFISSIKLTHNCLFTKFYSVLIVLFYSNFTLSKYNTFFNCITLKNVS